MRKKKEEKPVASFIWCGAVVQVYTQTITFAGTILQRHLLPKNLRSAVETEVQQAINQAVEKAAVIAVNKKEVAGAANHQEASPHHVQQNQRRVRNEEQQHYGVSARASQPRQRKKS